LVHELIRSVEVTTAQLAAIRGAAVECGVKVGTRARLQITASILDGLIELSAQANFVGGLGIKERAGIKPSGTEHKKLSCCKCLIYILEEVRHAFITTFNQTQQESALILISKVFVNFN